MSNPSEEILLSGELLEVMRNAASTARRLGDEFITTRALLLALLDDPATGPSLQTVVSRERLEALEVESGENAVAQALPEPEMDPAERAAIERYDTLAFKTSDGASSIWLSRESLMVFADGAHRCGEGPYLPKHLAFGIAAEAIRAPGVLRAIRVEPGVLSDAIYKIK